MFRFLSAIWLSLVTTAVALGAVPLPAGADDPVSRWASEGLFDATAGGNAITATGGQVAGWQDLVASLRLAQSTAAQRPKWHAEKGLVWFESGADQRMLASKSGNRNSFSLYLIGDIEPLRRGWTGSAFSGPGGGMRDLMALDPAIYFSMSCQDLGGVGQIGNPGCLSFFAGSYTHTNLRVPSSRCLIGYSGGTNYRVRVNGATEAGPATSSTAFTTFQVGFNAAARGTHGGVKEILLYSRQLTDAQEEALYRWAVNYRGVVDAANAPAVVVCEGDSNSDGVKCTMGQNWFNQLMQPYGYVAKYNLAEAGMQLDGLQTAAAARVDVLIQKGKPNLLFVFAGTNDIELAGQTGAQAYARLQTYCAARKAAGWDKVIVLTMLPRGIVANTETYRGNFNTLIRAACAEPTPYGPRVFAKSPGGTLSCDFIVDVGAHPELGIAGAQNNTTLFDADKIHFKDVAAKMIADDCASLTGALIGNSSGFSPTDRLLLANIVDKATTAATQSTAAAADAVTIKGRTNNLPPAPAGTNGGLPTVNASNQIAGIAAGGIDVIVDAFWDEPVSDHNGEGDAGRVLSDKPSDVQIRDSILQATLASFNGNNSVGQALNWMKATMDASGQFTPQSLADAPAGGVTYISPITVDKARTWRPDPLNASKAENIVTVKGPVIGTLAAIMPLNPDADIDEPEDVTIIGPVVDGEPLEFTATDLKKSADGRQIHFNVPDLAVKGVYKVTPTVSTVDGQTPSMDCTLIVR
ncbi:SGNH/GDSL hydrolase family protein [Lacipirellula sp.]|uniref:SGNH/GDSL hydrolase family protein n=1 Tax=Lacipirellula sp. TaxID=2691419 RepID=UPI003D112BA5